MADDYTFEISFDGEQDGKKVVELTCMPNEDAAVVWGKVVVTAEKGTWVPTVIRYYDEDMEMARTMTFSAVKKVGGRNIPMQATMVPSDKPDESTAVIYDEIDFDAKIKSSMFTKKSLQR
jgi:hypothetical protein